MLGVLSEASTIRAFLATKIASDAPQIALEHRFRLRDFVKRPVI
jgi:hypothetical protein